MTYEQIMAVIAEAQQSMQALAKIYPGCFDEHGRAIVATAHFPRRPNEASTPESGI